MFTIIEKSHRALFPDWMDTFSNLEEMVEKIGNGIRPVLGWQTTNAEQENECTSLVIEREGRIFIFHWEVAKLTDLRSQLLQTIKSPVNGKNVVLGMDYMVDILGTTIAAIRSNLSSLEYVPMLLGLGDSSYPTCPSCHARSYGSRSTEKHKENCVIATLLKLCDVAIQKADEYKSKL